MGTDGSTGDLKPGNIAFGSHSELRLIDFSGSTFVPRTPFRLSYNQPCVLREQITAFTSQYAAPELIKGEDEYVTSAVDMYSIGIILQELRMCCLKTGMHCVVMCSSLLSAYARAQI